jgi:hypothetical protein
MVFVLVPVLVFSLGLGTCYWVSEIRVNARRADVIGVRLEPYPEGPTFAFGDEKAPLPLAEISDLIPDPLPARAWQGFRCSGGLNVVMQLSGGRRIEYGPCRKPQSILALQEVMTVKQRAWFTERVKSGS